MESIEPHSDEEEVLSKIESDVDNDEESNSSSSEEENIDDSDNEISSLISNTNPLISNEDMDSDDDENYLQKFDEELTNNYIINSHPEDLAQNYSEVLTLSKIVKDDQGNIIDLFHKTNPILSKYEKTRILGLRTKQLNDGAPPLIKLNENIIDSYIIAEMELKEKKIPFIIQRPLPNGNAEYWALEDLEIL